MAEPKRFTVVFPDWHLGAYYEANTTYKRVKTYTQSDGSAEGNTTMKLEFANAATTLGYTPRSNYHAIQYVDGVGEIEYANGHPNTTFSGNTGIADFISCLDKWDKQVRVEFNEAERLASIPSWDEIRSVRDSLLRDSDGIYTFATEKSQTVPQDWIDYRDDLRDLPATYGANTGNTELVVWPTKPSWPNWS